MKKIILAVLLSALTTFSFAETYKVIIGTPPGSGSDVQTRKVFDLVAKETGDNFVFLNRPGGAFVISYRAFQEEAKNSPNVLLLTHGSTLMAAYVTHTDQKLDPLTETKGLIAFQRIRHFVVVREDSNIRSGRDIGGKLNIGFSSLYAEPLFRSRFKDGDYQFVPYKSENDATQALLSKEVDVIASHSLNTLLLAHKDRLRKVAPYGPSHDQFLGYSVPVSMAESDRRRLNAAIDKILKRPDIQEWFRETTDMPVEGGSPEHFDTLIRNSRENIRLLFNK